MATPVYRFNFNSQKYPYNNTAKGMYSLRKLDASATKAIRVRRSSDNTETDIGFVGNDLDTATLSSFASGTDAFVTTIYDQIGSNDCVQATPSAQPIIVSGGVIYNDSGFPVIRFEAPHFMVFPFNTDNMFLPLSFYAVLKNVIHSSNVFGNTTFFISGNGGLFLGKFELGYDSANTGAQYRTGVLASASTGNFSANIFLASCFYRNLVRIKANSTIASSDTIIEGNYSDNKLHLSTDSLLGNGVVNFLEFQLYNTDTSLQQTTIESDINTYYGL
jgi:hypothetical protein